MKPWLDHLLDLQNIPYLHQGHTREGVDCIGLIRLVCQERGLDVSQFDQPNRSYNPPSRQLITGLESLCGKPTGIWADFSIVVFRSYGMGCQHIGLCGVYEKERVFLHADRGQGKTEVIEYRPSAQVPIYGFYKINRLPELM